MIFINDSLKFPDGTQFYADIQDGKPGFNTDPERGADTFFPFSNIKFTVESSAYTAAQTDNTYYFKKKGKYLCIGTSGGVNQTLSISYTTSEVYTSIHYGTNLLAQGANATCIVLVDVKNDGAYFTFRPRNPTGVAAGILNQFIYIYLE